MRRLLVFCIFMNGIRGKTSLFSRVVSSTSSFGTTGKDSLLMSTLYRSIILVVLLALVLVEPLDGSDETRSTRSTRSLQSRIKDLIILIIKTIDKHT